MSTSGSPPLILAFLAIGLFSAALIFVFGWRRLQLSRGWRFTVVTVNHNRSVVELPTSTINVDSVVPKLWDIRNEGKLTWGKDEGNVKWVNLMPLSATEVLALPTTGESIIEPPHPRPLDSFLHTIPTLNRFNSRRNNRPSLSRHDSEKKESEADDKVKVTMQVAVTIVLPSPQYPIHIKNRNNDKHHKEGKNMDRQQITDYCIGMYECSWH